MSARRIVHLGLGNFHRAHQVVYTQDAGDGWTVTGVACRSRRVVEALRAQRMRYTVVTIDGSRSAVRPIDVITEAFVAADAPDAVLERIADPATRVVSLTVTEAGYACRPGRRELDVDSPAVRADLAGTDAARSTIGLLCRGLDRRAAAGAGPVTLLSCDNLSGNGEVLRAVTTQFAAAAGLDRLAAYLDTEVGFPSTMVDRIVPATTARHVELARAAGYDDAVPVPAEPFSQWVLQPDFRAGRPDWERAGAVVTGDVAAYEAVKVRLLNGSHSLIAYLGLLRGHEFIAAAFADPIVRAAADALGAEYVPTLRVPAGLDLDDYRVQLGRRFDNAALEHRTGQVGTDGSLKLAQRVPDAARWYLERGRTPDALALLMAAFLRVLTRADAVPGDRRPADPAAPRLADLGRRCPDPAELARAVLIDDALLGHDLAGRSPFVERVGELLGVLDGAGTDAAVAEVVT